MKAPLFQHRHYAAMAKIIASMPEAAREVAAVRFATGLLNTNPDFDSLRFLAAARGAPVNGRDK